MGEVSLREYRPTDRDWLVRAHDRLYARERGYDSTFALLVGEILDDFIETRDSSRERGWVEKLGLQQPPKPGAGGAAGLERLWQDTFARPLPPGVQEALRLEDRWILDRFAVATDEVTRSFDTSMPSSWAHWLR